SSSDRQTRALLGRRPHLRVRPGVPARRRVAYKEKSAHLLARQGDAMHGALLLLTLAAAPLRPPDPGDALPPWNEVALEATRAARTPPPMAARHLAMLHGAIYDAVNSVRRTHAAYRSDLATDGPTDPSVAASVAAHRVLVQLYPRQVDRFDRALDEALACAED